MKNTISEGLICHEHLICVEKLSDNLGERHLKAVFAKLDMRFKEKNNSFWQLLFSHPDIEGSSKLNIRGYVKEGVVWYDSLTYDRVSVDEEVELNHFFIEKEIEHFQQYELQIKMKTIFENLNKSKHKKKFVEYFKGKS